MKKELCEKLCNDFPLLYTECFGDSVATRMDDIPNGWFELIYKLSSDIEKIISRMASVESPRVLQIKEKFGTLRFYMSASNDEIDSLIDEAEKKTTTTCSECGAVGKLISIKGWIICLCKVCASMGG